VPGPWNGGSPFGSQGCRLSLWSFTMLLLLVRHTDTQTLCCECVSLSINCRLSLSLNWFLLLPEFSGADCATCPHYPNASAQNCHDYSVALFGIELSCL
jgi:hypothetical protein